MWADRQLAAMLRATPQTTLWFGGAAWMTPVVDYHLTARFGQSGSLWASTHTGLDFAAPTGTPVRAATAGTVTSVGWAGAYGNKIEITHPDGSETWYAHLSRTDVRVGSQVGTGALIGAVGATGNVTGSHLHFEVRPGGNSPIDPELALRLHGVKP
jgi:murein DD-endopeptidase MepM/ murein hydrolase activator NlpD